MSDLLTRAKEIKNATEIGENTAERVGGVMVDMVESIMSAEKSLTAQVAQINELKERNLAEIPTYSGVVESATIKNGSVTQYSGVYFIKREGRFAAKQGSEYFANWLAYGGYQAQPVYHQDNKAVPNRLYNLIALSGGGLHYFDGTTFKLVNDNAGVADMLMRSVMGGNIQVIEWSHTHNMNDYKETGTYRIKGERTGNPMDDNLPIMNSGSGHTIEGILYVLDSSLTNGSGKESDCTVTQILMLSNRVGGQEGDMYMRSAYGANKDSLTWKPWEKYQTNMEVGCMSDDHLLNPSNPTEILKNGSGMINLRDNGIYSGIYFGPKCMVGTGEDNWHISFQDATAIETFVMVVINNYASAGDARCITQIKFAVTNGGVFSMENRSTDPVTLSWSQWESVGGGSSLGEWDSSGDNIDMYNPVSLERSNKFGNTITIGSNVEVDAGVKIKGNNLRIHGYNGIDLFIGTGIGEDSGVLEVKLGNQTYIGKKVNIGEGVDITNGKIKTDYASYTIEYTDGAYMDFDTNMHLKLGAYGVYGNYGRIFPDGKIGNSTHYMGVDNRETGEGFRTGGSENWYSDDESSYRVTSYQMHLSKDNIRFRLYEETQDDEVEVVTKIAYGLTIEPSEDGNKLLISYNGKTAELQLT